MRIIRYSLVLLCLPTMVARAQTQSQNQPASQGQANASTAAGPIQRRLCLQTAHLMRHPRALLWFPTPWSSSGTQP